MDDKKRRVLIRLIGAPLIIAALFGILYLDYQRGRSTGLVILVGSMACISLHELCAMMRLKGMKPFEPGAILALALVFACQVPEIDSNKDWGSWVLAAAIGMTGIVVAVSVITCRALPVAMAYTALAVFIPLRGGWVPLAFLFATNKGSDMAAYSVGKLIGRHKLAPRISPNKTWEGAIAGLIVGSLAGAYILITSGTYIDPHARPVFIGLAVLVTIAAQVGDLVKSAIKRWAGVKDSGRLLPEFGGALDMIDSFLVSAPVFYLCTLLL